MVKLWTVNTVLGSNFFFTLFDIVGTLKKIELSFIWVEKNKAICTFRGKKKETKTFYSRNTKQGGLLDKD